MECQVRKPRKDYDLIKAYNRKRTVIRKSAHICTRCGLEDAYTIAGRSLCADCAEKARQCKAKQYEDEGKKQRMYSQHCNGQQKRRDAGLCPTCGRPSTPGYSTCEYCRAKHRNYMRQRRNNPPRGAYGICWNCNKAEAMPGKRVCQTCYEILCRNLEKGREVQAEMKANGWMHPWIKDDNIVFRKRVRYD